MNQSQRPGDPCIVVIFGAAGDLTKRKLIPALYNLSTYGLLPREVAVVGVARRPFGDGEFRAQMATELEQFATGKVDADQATGFMSGLYFVSGDLGDPATYAALKAKLADIQQRHQIPPNVLFYMATPPTSFGDIA